jgi:hypothetical protein
MDFFENPAGMALVGGILIGLAFGVLTLLTGRVLSASGMIGSLLGGAEGVAATSIAFIGGIVAAPLFMTGLAFAELDMRETGWPWLVAGGLLVGVSARLGGASLGAVVTGISRRAPRSAIMLLTLLVGAATGALLQAFVLAGGNT